MGSSLRCFRSELTYALVPSDEGGPASGSPASSSTAAPPYVAGKSNECRSVFVEPLLASTCESVDGNNGSFPSSSPSAVHLTKNGRHRALSKPVASVPNRALASCRAVCRGIAESSCLQALTFALTIYALVGSDVRLIFFDKSSDYWFDLVVMLCVSVFVADIFVSCLGKEDYFLGFFFALDVVSTATMALDMSWVDDASISHTGNTSGLRAGRTARIGARAARMLRALRLVRLAKLYKVASGRLAQNNDAEGLGINDDEDEKIDEQAQESRIGAKLSDLTTRRIILAVLALLFGLPVLQVDRTKRIPASADYGANVVWKAFRRWEAGRGSREAYEEKMLDYIFYHALASKPAKSSANHQCPTDFYNHVFWFGMVGRNPDIVRAKADLARVRRETVTRWLRDGEGFLDTCSHRDTPAAAVDALGAPWVAECELHGMGYFGVSFLQQEGVRCPQDLRFTEIEPHFPESMTDEQYQQYHIVFMFDVRPLRKDESVANLTITGFVCVILTVVSMVLSSDVAFLVLNPIENMIRNVQIIRKDPRMAGKIAHDDFKAVEAERLRSKQKQRYQGPLLMRLLRQLEDLVTCRLCYREQVAEEPLETHILEKTIMKLASLLTLGLGEAGVELIADSLSRSGNAGTVDVFSMPQRRIEAIMGVIRILDFSTAVEVLQAKVVKFVDHVTGIVHGTLYAYSGSPNRNNGDTLLVVWRLPVEKSDEAVSVHTELGEGASRVADMAIIALSKIMAATLKSRVLAEYSRHPVLQSRLGSNYRVGLTFGLHQGWAIEGAVGSEFKIDASYFSPHVSIAFAVEGATKTYGVRYLATGPVVSRCVPKLQMCCRLIDRVVITGSKEPMDIFVIDLDPANLHEQDENPLPRNVRWNMRMRFLARQWMESERIKLWSERLAIEELFEGDPDIVRMRKPFTQHFFNTFSMGYLNYAAGQWQAAQLRLQQTLKMLGFVDGPSKALLKLMDDHWGAESEWRGYHKLTDFSEEDPSAPSRLPSRRNTRLSSK